MCLYNQEFAYANTQNGYRVVLVSTWVRSRAEAVERDLLVAYPVIDIRGLPVMFPYTALSMGSLSSFHAIVNILRDSTT